MAGSTILHLIDTGGPGGAETIFLELVRHFSGPLWQSVAVVPCHDWLYEALREQGVEPVVVATDGPFDIGYLARLAKFARKRRVSLIQTHLLTTAVYGGAVGRLLGLPVVSTFHGQVDVHGQSRMAGLKARIIDRRRSRAVFVSEALRASVLRQLRLTPGLTRVVHNGIDTALFAAGTEPQVRAELGVAETEILIGAVGNIRVSKDYPNLLKAAAALRRRSSRYRFVIAGDPGSGPLYSDLLRQRAALHLENAVAFLGFRADVPALLRSCDVFALSSNREGFSLATVQAMAAGVPVVATRSGGPEEIITHEHDGLLVPTHEPESLADAIERVACDYALRDLLGRNAERTVAARFGLAAMTRGYEDIYFELLPSAAV